MTSYAYILFLLHITLSTRSTYLCSKCIQRLLLAESTYHGDSIDAPITSVVPESSQGLLCLLHVDFPFAHRLSLLAAVHPQPGHAHANTIIQMIYSCLAPVADIHTAPRDSTGTNSLLRRPTFETMEDGTSVHVLLSGRPSQSLLHLDCEEVCPLKPRCFTTRFPGHLRRGNKGHTCPSDRQHVGALMANHRVASLAPCV